MSSCGKVHAALLVPVHIFLLAACHASAVQDEYQVQTSQFVFESGIAPVLQDDSLGYVAVAAHQQWIPGVVPVHIASAQSAYAPVVSTIS